MVRDRRIPPDTRLAGSTPCLIVGVHRDQHLALDMAALLPRRSEEEFVGHCRRLFAKRYPDINRPDFTSIIDQRSYDRLAAALEDARLKGARLIISPRARRPTSRSADSRRISS